MLFLLEEGVKKEEQGIQVIKTTAMELCTVGNFMYQIPTYNTVPHRYNLAECQWQGFQLTNRPQFSMVYTLKDHRNDVIKCSKLNWNTSCRRVVSLQSGATVLQEHRTLLPSPLQSRWLSWMSWAGVIVPMMVRPLLVLRCSTFLARYVFINTCRKSLAFNILK